ncbi:hypothetical protein E2C01_026210 [Portunus trituberculatus]|uniref:Uncharacterized protein n=1 Tax=Portunus trituberculatus TaxID=210409 RepID=A0A5B7EHS2_PORTR|nr:hypothetical protein [Portunus trituberculatus]
MPPQTQPRFAAFPATVSQSITIPEPAAPPTSDQGLRSRPLHLLLLLPRRYYATKRHHCYYYTGIWRCFLTLVYLRMYVNA